MSHDDCDRRVEIFKRCNELHMKVAEARGYLLGMGEGITQLNSLIDKDSPDPRIVKKGVGMTRDVGLKFIEMGQQLRRIADLIEPLLDEEIKEEG